MSVIHLHRHHHLGLPAARKIAFMWAEQVEEEFDMECTYEEGETSDTVTFTRSGVKGTLQVLDDQFELRAELGFLVGAFKGRIEHEITRQLDALLPAHPAGKKPKAAPRKK